MCVVKLSDTVYHMVAEDLLDYTPCEITAAHPSLQWLSPEQTFFAESPKGST